MNNQKLFLQEAQQNSLAPLNASLDKLQSLAEQLDPLELAYSEVRFLDVDFEQLEKQYEDVLGEMRDEMEHEKALAKAVQQLANEVDELQQHIHTAHNNPQALQTARQTTVPVVCSKLAALKDQHVEAIKKRKRVARADQPSLDQLGINIEESNNRAEQLLLALTQQQTDTVVKRIRTILVRASEQIPSEQEIMECAKELEQIPVEDQRATELCQEIEELKWKKKRRDAIQARVDEQLQAIGQKLEETSEQFPAIELKAKKQKGKKKQRAKGKKPSPAPSEQKPRDQQIHELRKAVELLESDVLPTLDSIRKEAIDEGIPMQPSEEEQHQLALAKELEQSLKVSFKNQS